MNSLEIRSLIFVAYFAVWLCGHAGAFAQEQTQTLRVELPVKNNQYDAAPLNQVLRKKVTGDSLQAWFPLTGRTRLALAILESEGTIASYAESSDRLIIEFDRVKLYDVQKALFPPRLVGEDAFKNQPKIVLFIHGLEGSESSFRDLIPAFGARGWLPMQLVYPNDGDIHKPALFLRAELERLHAKNPAAQIVVVAHSLGGLVAWDALADNDTAAAGLRQQPGETGVTDLVTLGTPFGGSKMARFQSELEMCEVVRRVLSRDWSGLDITSDGEGEAMEILAPQSVTRHELLARRLPDSIRLHVAIGDSGPIAANEQVKFASLIERLLSHRSSDDDLAVNLRYLSTAPELVAGVGDGAVTIDSASAIKNPTNLRTFHRSHVGLLQLTGDEPNEVLRWILENVRR